MSWVDRILAVCLIGACWGLWPQTSKFPGSAAEFPRLMLIVTAVLATLMLVRSIVPSLASASGGEGSNEISKTVRPLAVFAATAATVYAVRHIGFFPAVAALGLALWSILGVRTTKTYVAAYIGLMALVYLLFQLLLNVPLNSTRLWGG